MFGGIALIDQTIKESLTSSYNKQAFDRDSLHVQDWKTKERDIFVSYLEKENTASLLEIGAGPGKDSSHFKSIGLETVSTDLSPEMVKLCRDKGLNAYVMSFDHLKFTNNAFDSVWALNCLLHVPKANLVAILQEIKRVLKPDGLFYLGVYGGSRFEGVWEDDFYKPKRFFSFYGDEELKDILSSQFKVEYFNVVPTEIVGGEYHFQSVILRKSEVD
jgi:SAM-dependent methyltransferase